MDYLLQDLRYGARSLLRQPSFATLAILTLALGIGATSAIFSVVYGIVLQPLPYREPDRLTAIWEVNNRGTYSRLADPNFDDFRDQNHSFLSIAKYRAGVVSVSGFAEPIRASAAVVSKDFFTILGVSPIVGRSMAGDEAHPGAAPTLLARASFWKGHLGSADLSTLKLHIQDRVYSVIGILPDTFDFPPRTDLWLASDIDPQNPSRTSHNYLGIGRLRNGVSVAQAHTDLAAIADRIIHDSPEQNDYLMRSAAAVPLQEALTGRVRSPLYILFGAVGVLLLVACANVATLLLAQASKRAHELAIRNALGAGRHRLVQQLITETLLLAAFSGVAGIIIAVIARRGLLALAPQDLPRLDEVAASWPVLLFTTGVSAMVAVGLGTFAALRATSGAPREALGEGERGNTGGVRRQRVGRAIVAAQLAMTLALLTSAGLLGRSLLAVLSVDPGFRIDNILTIDVRFPETDHARISQLLAALTQRLHQIPGVQHVAAASAVPMDEGGLPDGMFLEGGSPGSADFGVVSPEYFQALGIPLKRGRLFDERDGFDAPHVAVVSESLVRTRWPNQNPLGRTLQFGNMDGDRHLLTVVGIVGDTHEYGLEQPPRPTVYVNALQRPRPTLSIVMRADRDTAQVVVAARGILREQLPDVPPRFRTFTQIFEASLGSRRFNLALVAAFALAALLLAVAGVYGLVSHSVGQRTQEIGVRMVLGAQTAHILGLILRQGLEMTMTGVAIGISGSFVTARTIQSLLFGINATDPLTFAGVAVGLIGVAALACYIPARRATKVDPLTALRAN